jgi:hypothetical protein
MGSVLHFRRRLLAYAILHMPIWQCASIRTGNTYLSVTIQYFCAGACNANPWPRYGRLYQHIAMKGGARHGSCRARFLTIALGLFLCLYYCLINTGWQVPAQK